MQGHHEVRVFAHEGGTLFLPAGWKPFAVYGTGAPLYVVCRKWIRDESK